MYLAQYMYWGRVNKQTADELVKDLVNTQAIVCMLMVPHVDWKTFRIVLKHMKSDARRLLTGGGERENYEVVLELR